MQKPKVFITSRLAQEEVVKEIRKLKENDTRQKPGCTQIKNTGITTQINTKTFQY